MFDSLPHTFRKHQIAADARTLLLLRKAMDRGLVRTLGDLYYVLQGLLTKAPTDRGPFVVAFYEHFLQITIHRGESLQAAIIRSETFKNWRLNQEEPEESQEIDLSELVDRFLNEIHLTSFDIQQRLSGQDILRKDNPELEDQLNQEDRNPLPEERQEMVDYRDIPLEELLERMREVAKRQKDRHQGGSHWIGSGGTSPYGNSGAAAGGIRVGGGGGGKMARKVINSSQYYPVDTKAQLRDDNIDAALAALKGIEEETSQWELDVPVTIKEGIVQGGFFLPYEREKTKQKVQVILLIDNGGWSMSPYVKTVTKLFSKMKTRFVHDLKTYYFHNTIYGGVYSDARRSNFISVDRLAKHHKNHSVFVIGDADMAPYELDYESLADWQRINKRFPRMAWLNPMRESVWQHSITTAVIGRLFPMFPLTPDGIEQAILEMNRKRGARSEGRGAS